MSICKKSHGSVNDTDQDDDSIGTTQSQHPDRHHCLTHVFSLLLSQGPSIFATTVLYIGNCSLASLFFPHPHQQPNPSIPWLHSSLTLTPKSTIFGFSSILPSLILLSEALVFPFVLSLAVYGLSLCCHKCLILISIWIHQPLQYI